MQPPAKKADGGILSLVEGEEEDSYDDRTPENIEILSNNLRGDVRSMDERYNELAQMVGEEQAAQTPPEVVALFQTKMTQQPPMPPVPAAKANGIAGLMGGPQPPQQGGPMPPGAPPMPPGAAPMPPNAPPTPTGEPPVQRQAGSGMYGEYSPERGFGMQGGGGGLRIDVSGVGDDRRDLQRESIAPVTGIPEVIAQTPSFSTDGPRFSFQSLLPSSGMSSPSFDSFGSQGSLAPPLQSADAFVQGYQSQGGDLSSLLGILAAPVGIFQKGVESIGNFLQGAARNLPSSPSPQRQSFGGIESLVAETPSALSPQTQETIEEVAQQFTQVPQGSSNPLSAASSQQRTENASSGLLGGGLGKLLGGLGGLGGKDKGGGTGDAIDDYLRMMAFASPRFIAGRETEDDSLDAFGNLPGRPEQITAFDSLADVTSPPIGPVTTNPEGVEVFPVKSPEIGVKPLAPQRMAAKGSGPEGERKEPILRIKDQINASDPFNLGGKPETIRAPELMPQAAGASADVDVGKSRPLTPEELDDYMRSKGTPQNLAQMTAKERAALSPATKTLYQMSQQMGVDPIELTKRINTLSGTLKKLPGVGKLFKGLDAFNKLSPGKQTAIAGGAATAGVLGVDAMTQPKPNDGVVPPVPPSKFGVEQIPTEYDAQAAALTPPSDGGDGAPPDIGKPLEVDMFPGITKDSNQRLMDAAMQLPDAAAQAEEGEVLGPRLPETDEEPEIAKATDTARTALGVTAKPGDDDYEAQVRKRAEVYQRLLGDNPEDRQMKAYLLLAEAGLKMMSTKGRSFGEIMGKSLQGLPSGLGQISADSSKIRRAAISAAISDVNAQKLQETKSAASLATALARTQASQLPRTQKILGNFNLLTQHYGFPADNPLTEQVATGLVDGTITTDKRGNLRGPTGEVIPRFGYGPANQPLKEDESGFIPNENPFLQDAPVKPTPIVDEKGMMDADAQIYNLQKSLGYLQAAKRELGNVVGPVNVVQRGISSVTQPILGDLGPFTAFAASRGNVVDRANRSIQEIVALNPERVSVYEQEQNAKLQIDKNSFFNSPQIELAKVLRFETELVNEINKLKYRLNPEGGLKQMRVPNLGTKDDPLETQAFPALGEYFKSQPGAKVYWQDQNGKVHALTKQQYESGMKR